MQMALVKFIGYCFQMEANMYYNFLEFKSITHVQYLKCQT